MSVTDYRLAHEAIYNTIYENNPDYVPVPKCCNNYLFKKALTNWAQFIPGLCGDDLDMKIAAEKLIKYGQYNRYNENSKYSYDTERNLLSDALIKFYENEDVYDKQSEDLEKAAAITFSGVDKNKMSAAAKQSDQRYISAIRSLISSYICNISMSYLFECLLPGLLEIPDEKEMKNVFYGNGSRAKSPQEDIINMPCYLHLPVPDDISEKQIEKNRCLSALKRIAENKDYVRLLYLLHDNDDGSVWVRLWNANSAGEWEPVYVKVCKLKVYWVWVLKENHQCLWTGLINEAFSIAGIDTDNMRDEEFARHCFGPDYVFTEKSDYAAMNADSFFEDHYSEYAVFEYAKIVSDFGKMMLSTASLFEEDDNELYALSTAARLYFYEIVWMLGNKKDVINPEMEYLKKTSDKYRSKASGSSTDSIRHKICKAIDVLYEIYHKEGRTSMYPYTYIKNSFIDKFAVKLSMESGKTYKPEDLYTDSILNKLIENQNIVAICLADEAQLSQMVKMYRENRK